MAQGLQIGQAAGTAVATTKMCLANPTRGYQQVVTAPLRFYQTSVLCRAWESLAAEVLMDRDIPAPNIYRGNTHASLWAGGHLLVT